MNSETPSIPGWYITFQTAILKQLPRPGNIDQTTADAWAQNQLGLRKILNNALCPPQAESKKLSPKELHDKLLGIRRRISFNEMINLHSSKHLASGVLFNLALAAGEEKLAEEVRARLEQTSRSDILCQILRQAEIALAANHQKFGLNNGEKDRFRTKTDEEIYLEQNVYRLTEEQVLETYGVRAWQSPGRRANNAIYANFLSGAKAQGII